MKKAIITLAICVIILSVAVIQLQNENRRAKAYIEQLEHDFPEFIDTTSGTDTYNEYYQ